MTEVFMVQNPENAHLDIVFIHGLDGDARATWSSEEPNSFWPQWLAEELPTAAIWTINYDAWSSRWRGNAMSMQDRGINLLAQMQIHGIGERPLCFVTHSMGGLLAKEILLHAAEGYNAYGSFAAMTRGVVFLATPHTGSGLTKAVEALGVLYRGTPAVRDLERNSAYLRHLNDRYRDWVDDVGIRHLVFFEAHQTRGVRVVDEASANPGLARVRPIAVDADHVVICKPMHRRSLVYGQVLRFARELLDSTTPPRDIPSPGEPLSGGGTEEGNREGPAGTEIEGRRGDVAADDRDPPGPASAPAPAPAPVPAPAPASVPAPVPVAERPYDLIRPTGADLNWYDLLDGRALTADFGPALTLERTVELDGAPLDPPAVLSWLAAHPDRTLFLAGERGDGKTSYLNTLAAQSVDTHFFLLWAHDVPFSVRAAERYGAELQRTLPGAPKTVVIVYRFGPYRNSQELEHLAGELSASAGRGGRRVSVVVEGDDGTFARMPFYSAHTARLLPPGAESTRRWAELIGRACAEIRREGHSDEWIADRYPNLLNFLRSTAQEQEQILADPDAPMIVRLLRAVYGSNMWGTLYNEFRLLRPPAPDAVAYLHVCLATLSGRGMSADMLDALQPEADSDPRSLRDPWIRDGDGRHVARHHFIAQAVLEKAARRGGEKLIRACVARYPEKIRVRPYATLLRQVVLAHSHLTPKETGALRAAVLTGARRGLRQVDGPAAAIEGHCARDYRELSAWMEMVRALIPTKSRDPSHLWLCELHRDLLDAAERTDNRPQPERLTYYRAKTDALRAWMLNKEDYDLLLELVEAIAGSVGAYWCRADFYTDLFSWCYRAVRLRLHQPMDDDDAEDLYFLCDTLCTAYEYLRTLVSEEDVNWIRRDFNTVMLRDVHWQLSDHAADLVVRAWETSVQLGMPDPQMGVLHAEGLLAGGERSPATPEEVDEACRVLLTVHRFAPEHGEALFLLALAQQRYGVLIESWAELLDDARKSHESPLSGAFLAQAEGLTEPDPERRTALLTQALTGYAEYIEGRRGKSLDAGAYAIDRLRFAAEEALDALRGVNEPEVERARQRHRRLASYLGSW